MRHLWNKIPSYLKNTYSASFIAFIIWLGFFDRNDLISQIQWRSELRQLERDKEYFKEQIEQTRNDLDELMTNDEKLEKFAREKYLMKKDDEEVYIIVAKD